MIGNIRSEFFLKYLFSHVKEKKALQLVNHNKSLQLKLGKDLINYKISSNKYTIYEKNGYRKIYNGFDDELIFEGEYLNGEKNGKGKEYDTYNDKLEFEGEYLNGKRNGKGREYNTYNGKLEFEGEYINGKRISK